jgi:CRP-like cAMP-binding protein
MLNSTAMAIHASQERKWPALVSPRPVGNDILAALLGTEYKHLRPKLERVVLKAGETIYRADQTIEYVYFPEDAVIAMVDTDTTDNHRTVEVGVIGHEGLVGINIFLGGLITPDKAIVQLAGSAMRMKSKDLRKEMRFGNSLQRLLLQYTRTFLAVISQSVACSQHHTVEQRVARWVLTMSDYAGEREFMMVQQSIAAMLGVRRVSVTDAAAKFQSARMISYSRGRIKVIERTGLSKQSCECYEFIKRQYSSLHKALPRVLKRV